MIVQPDGTITVATPTPTILSAVSGDESKRIARFAFPDSTLATEHLLIIRDFGRKIGGDGLVSRKGKVSSVKEKILDDGKRRSLNLSINVAASADYTQAEIESEYELLGQFLIDFKSDLAAGNYDV